MCSVAAWIQSSSTHRSELISIHKHVFVVISTCSGTRGSLLMRWLHWTVAIWFHLAAKLSCVSLHVIHTHMHNISRIPLQRQKADEHEQAE